VQEQRVVARAEADADASRDVISRNGPEKVNIAKELKAPFGCHLPLPETC